jgi:hypothetical protein
MDKQEKLRVELDLAIRELISKIQNRRAEYRQWKEETMEISLLASRWKETQIEPTPIICRELCYNCKEPWELDHRCRGKGKVHIVEVHYDSEDKEVYEDAQIYAYLEQSDDTSDSCASKGQLVG